MIHSRTISLLISFVVLASCKLGVKSSSAKTDVLDINRNLLAFAAVTTLAFRDKQLPAWEVEARIRCGDVPFPQPSRLNNLVYELIPASTRKNTAAINRGDSALCRYQPPTPDNISLTRNLFADKALAIKVKYLQGYENQPPPMISFNSGGALHVSPERFHSLFLGQCSQFKLMNGIQFCKTTDSDHGDGRVIWVALIAPTVGSSAPHTGGKDGKGGVVVVEQQQAGKFVEPVGQIDLIKGVEQVDFGKGGKDAIMPFTPGGGRIDMNITLPWMQHGFNLAVEVPNFNHELIAKIQGTGDIHQHPPVGPAMTTDYGKKLDRDQIAILVPRPLHDPRGSSEDSKLLRLTLKTRPNKPHEGRWAGFIKIGATIGGGVASVLISGIAPPAAIVLVPAGVAITASGIGDLQKWWKGISDRGAYDDFMVPSDAKSCPAIYGTNLTFDDSDLYLTFKSERRQGFVVDWWDNLGRIQFVPIGTIGVNAWSQAVLEGFTVHYCRKSHEKHCTTLPATKFSDELKSSLQNCANTDDSVIAEFGQH